jgi:pyruvate kinase
LQKENESMTKNQKAKSIESYYQDLLTNLRKLCQDLLATEQEFENHTKKVHLDHTEAAINLIHYLGLRRHDLRKLQAELARVGLSSLGRSESKVLPTLYSITHLLESALNIDHENQVFEISPEASLEKMHMKFLVPLQPIET